MEGAFAEPGIEDYIEALQIILLFLNIVLDRLL